MTREEIERLKARNEELRQDLHRHIKQAFGRTLEAVDTIDKLIQMLRRCQAELPQDAALTADIEALLNKVTVRNDD